MPDTVTRIWIAGILAGLAAIAVVVFVALGPGRFHPSPPSLAGHLLPGLDGTIAYIDNEGCIQVVDPSTGDTRQLRCEANRPQGLTFIDGHTLAYFVYTGKTSPDWVAVDIVTGNTTTLGTFADPGWNYDQTLGGVIYVAQDGEVFVEEDGVRRSIFSASFPKYYQPQPIALSPDGKWLLAGYSAPRAGDGRELWVIAMDGSGARTVTEHANWDMRAASWWIDGFGATPEMDHPSLPAARAR